MRGEITLRPIVEADLPYIAELNNAAMPAVPYADPAKLSELLRFADLKLAAVDAGEPSIILGFVVAIPAGAGYDSENYQWFEDLAQPHVYVDRIVIAEQTRGYGIGRLLYDAVFAHARKQDVARVTCEVNTDPPNPASMAFHGRLGFEELGRQSTKGGTVQVALLGANSYPG